MNYPLTCKCKLADLLRSVIPVTGIDFSKMIVVDLAKGERVGRHTHAYHTALYYPSDASPITVEPIAGMVIYMPPGTPHAVPAATEKRVSLAMLVEPEDKK